MILDGNWQTQISVAASQRPPLCLSATEELGPLLIHGIRGDHTQTRKDKVWEGKWMRMASEERQNVKLINNSSGGQAGGWDRNGLLAKILVFPYRSVISNVSVLMSRRVEVTETIREWRT